MATPTEMRAALATAPGSPLTIVNRPIPVPGAGEILVRVRASGTNPLDLKIRAGEAAHARQPLPSILGIDMAGSVAALGADVTGFAIGDAVFGMVGGVGGHQGTLADFIAVDADLLAKKPAALSFREAAALPPCHCDRWRTRADRLRSRRTGRHRSAAAQVWLSGCTAPAAATGRWPGTGTAG